MNSERLLKQFFEMVKMESPSWHEGAFGSWCASELEGMGFRVVFDDSAERTGSDTGNLIAHLPGTAGGRIVLSAHMDTVKPCEGIEPFIERRHVCDEVSCRMIEVACSAGDTILSADDKAGVAAIFEGVRSVLEEGAPRPDITVLFTTCEEQSLLGSSALKPEALVWPADMPSASNERILGGPVPCFVFDADGAPGSIIMGAPYHYTLRARITGCAAHAGVAPEEGVNAIQIAAAAISAMPLGRIDECTTANIGRIEGGVAVNIVPAEVALEGECRSLYEDRVHNQQEAMTAALEEAAARFGGTVEIEWTQDYPAVVHEPEDDIVRHLQTAIRACNLEPRFANSGGGADANVLNTRGLDAITLGIGMANFHTPDEFIAVEDLENTARLVQAIIVEYAVS